MKCSICGRRYSYPKPKYVGGQANRLIGTRRHYAKHHPNIVKRWHKGIKHPHPKKKRRRRKR